MGKSEEEQIGFILGGVVKTRRIYLDLPLYEEEAFLVDDFPAPCP